MSRLTKKDTELLKKQLSNAVVEKDVENAYRAILDKEYADCDVSSVHGTDGCYSNLYMRLLLEVKYNENYLEKSAQCKTIAQALYYIKRFQDNQEQLPNVVFVGDNNECFVVYGGHLYKYLDEELDWSIPPSDAAKANPDLILKLVEDNNISAYVFSVAGSHFDFNDVCKSISELAQKGQPIKIKVTEHSIRLTYDNFLRLVIKDKEDKYTTNQLVSIFLQAMTNSRDCYLHPMKRNVLVLPNKAEIEIDGSAFNAFFARFDRNYSAKEIDTFNSIADRLLEETERRKDGAFFTPSAWADRAIQMIDENLGDEWKEKYVVWDASCGSMNLTRDYKFSSLYASTLYEEELELGRNYNPEAMKFQYDFLNDDIDIGPDTPESDVKMPIPLFRALKENRPIVFYQNPPYATANNAGATGTAKTGIANTLINKWMKAEGFGAASQQLFAQFIGRILKLKADFRLTNVVIAFFMKPLLFYGTGYYKPFCDRFFNEFSFMEGNLFNAGEFEAVSSNWGITFSIFSSQKKQGKNAFSLDVEETFEDAIRCIGKKKIHPIKETESCSFWIRELIEDIPTVPKGNYPQMSSALKVNEGDGARGTLKEGALGYMVAVANNVFNSQRDVFIVSSAAYKANGVSVLPLNFERCCSVFSARNLVDGNWINDKDEFFIPDTQSEKYKEWESDAVILSIFHNQSAQASMRGVAYRGQNYNVPNQWFFMSSEKMRTLSEEYSNQEIGFDVRLAPEAFVYTWLQNHKISPEGRDLLNIGEEIIKSTFKYRSILQLERPDLHLNTWDAGWFQVKQLLKAYPQKLLYNEFIEARKNLQNKMLPLVYELGFLKE